MTSCRYESGTSSQSQKTKTKEWYEGGTLHRAIISDWINATDQNKLATCANFMATVDNTVSMTELKRRATQLKNCIDETIKGLESTNNESVAEIASACTILLGYKK